MDEQEHREGGGVAENLKRSIAFTRITHKSPPAVLLLVLKILKGEIASILKICFRKSDQQARSQAQYRTQSGAFDYKTTRTCRRILLWCAKSSSMLYAQMMYRELPGDKS